MKIYLKCGKIVETTWIEADEDTTLDTAILTCAGKGCITYFNLNAIEKVTFEPKIDFNVI